MKAALHRIILLASFLISMTVHHTISADLMNKHSVDSSAKHRVLRDVGVCGGTFTEDSGSFSTPNYPNDYPHNEDCYYYINVDGSPNQHIMLEFTKFSVYSYDSVWVYDGNTTNSTEIGPFSGDDLPPPIRSSGTALLVYFHSNEWGDSTGFLAKYESTLSDCGGIFTKPSGTISSPNYPDEYSENQDCYYFIIAPEGSRLMMQFEVTNLGYDDVVSVYDGFNTDGNLLTSSYGGYIDSPIRSYGNVMLVHFEPGRVQTGGSFLAKYNRDTCGGTYFANINEGYIISPFYPNYYSNNMDNYDDCYFIIVVADGNTIQVEFLDFGLESCCASLTIYDGDSNNYPIIGEYTGYKLPPDIESTGSNLYLDYDGEAYHNSRGFYLVYHTGTVNVEGPFSVCGNNFAYGINGFITSHATYPSNYPTNQDCNITIVTAGGYNHIGLRILNSDLTNTDSPNCDGGDAIFVYDIYGNIGSVCSSGGYHNFKCYGNMTINFRTFDHAGVHSGFKAYFTVYEERDNYWDSCTEYRDFSCSTSLRCLSRQLVCNGYNDCGDDNSDEENCPNPGRDLGTILGCTVVIFIVVIVLIVGIMCWFGREAKRSDTSRQGSNQQSSTRQPGHSNFAGTQINPSGYPT